MPSDPTTGPLSPSATRALLERLGHRPRKPLGQNFLIDGNIVRKSLELAGIAPGDRVVEVGPGLGTLTGALLEAGARVHAVELDPRLAGHLRELFGDRIELTEGDAVEHPRAGLGETEAAEGYKVVANLPYAITSPWMDELLAGPLPDRMVLMMQKEAADRLTAQPGTKQFSAIAIFLQSAFEKAGRHTVSRQCFHPVPGVDSVLLTLRQRETIRSFPADIRVDIRRIFGQRRKQIGALVRGNAKWEKWLDEAAKDGVRATDRAEAIPLKAWQLLAR